MLSMFQKQNFKLDYLNEISSCWFRRSEGPVSSNPWSRKDLNRTSGPISRTSLWVPRLSPTGQMVCILLGRSLGTDVTSSQATYYCLAIYRNICLSWAPACREWEFSGNSVWVERERERVSAQFLEVVGEPQQSPSTGTQEWAKDPAGLGSQRHLHLGSQMQPWEGSLYVSTCLGHGAHVCG